jgi:short-subunit dehydrogenase
MAEPFARQVVLITGAGSGIGRQLALSLAGQGAAIAAVDLREEPLAALREALAGKRVATAVADVTDREGLDAAARRLEEQLGPVDVLIANAGIGIETSALQYRAEDVEVQVRVNLIGVSNSVGAVLPGMLARGRGHLVAISSLAAYRGLPLMAGYCAAKAGVNALMDAVRVEVRPRGVHVTTVCPGWTRTALTDNVSWPKEGMMSVEYAAGRVVDAIRRRRVFCAFPARGAWQVWLLRWLPPAAGDRLIGRLLARLRSRAARPGALE